MTKRSLFAFLALIIFGFSTENVLYRLTHLDGFSPNHKDRLEEMKHLSKVFEKQFPFAFNNTPIDILIPTVGKDLLMLPHTIAYARKNLLHPIHNIYIVAPQDPAIISVARQMNCIFVNEAEVLPIRLSDIDYFPSECGGCDRRGWLYQQFLKLSCDEICESEHVLVIDTDTLLVRPQIYIYNGYTIFQCSDEYHLPYRESYQRLVGEEAKGPFSFVSHTTLFEKTKLSHFKRHIENRHHKPWFQAIMDQMDKNQASAFAENESYPQFVVSHYPDSFLQLYFFNDSTLCRGTNLKPFLTGNWRLDRLTKSVSFHSYND